MTNIPLHKKTTSAEKAMKTVHYDSLIRTVSQKDDIATFHIENANTAWTEVLHLGTLCHFPKGHAEPGEKRRGFFLITKGNIHLDYTSQEGKQRIFLTIGKNSIFNEVPAMLLDASGISFVCPEPIEAYQFSTNLLHDTAFISQYPHLYLNIMQSLAAKTSFFASLIYNAGFATTRKQLCRLLLKLHLEEDVKKETSMSQVEIAARLGVHPTTIARAIQKLRKEGAIGSISKRSLEIKNLSLLQDIANIS